MTVLSSTYLVLEGERIMLRGGLNNHVKGGEAMLLTGRRRCAKLPSRWHLIHPRQPYHRRDPLLTQARSSLKGVWQYPDPKRMESQAGHSSVALIFPLAPQRASVRQILDSVTGSSVPNYPAPSSPAECDPLG